MMIPKLVAVAGLALLAALATGSGACTDESDACKAYCERAAECLDCGGNVSMSDCQQQCVDLSFDQQKQLANCAKDCANVYACQQMVGFVPPSPCVF